MTYARLIIWSVLLGLNVALSSAVFAGENAKSAAVVIPTTFESGHFYAKPELTNGRRMLRDIGGGGYPTLFVDQAQANYPKLNVDHSCAVNGASYQSHPQRMPMARRCPI